MQTNIFFL